MPVHYRIELEFGNVGFADREKPQYLEKNLSKQGREPTTNSAHIIYDMFLLKSIVIEGVTHLKNVENV